MVDEQQLPPPPPASQPTRSTPPPPPPGAVPHQRLNGFWSLLAVAVAIATALAIAIGTVAGFVVAAASSSSCSPSDGWCGLGALLLGFAAAVVLGGIAYITVGVITISRFRPNGDRAGHVTALLATPVVVITLLTILAAIAENMG